MDAALRQVFLQKIQEHGQHSVAEFGKDLLKKLTSLVHKNVPMLSRKNAYLLVVVSLLLVSASCSSSVFHYIILPGLKKCNESTIQPFLKVCQYIINTYTVKHEVPVPIPVQKMKIFFSYDWGAKPHYPNKALINKIATSLNHQLLTHGFTCWIDQKEISGIIAEDITAGVKESHCCLLFLSQRYNSKIAGGKGYLSNEFQYIGDFMDKKRIIPLILDDFMDDPVNWNSKLAFYITGSANIPLMTLPSDIADPNYTTTINQIKNAITKLPPSYF
jgi:hypothetical protein